MNGKGPAARRRAIAKRLKEQAAVLPECTCSVRLATGKDLPDCPRGLATGHRYETWDEVPNDVLLPDKYEERNGHPPPRCPVCESWLYECDDECSLCRLRRRLRLGSPD